MIEAQIASIEQETAEALEEKNREIKQLREHIADTEE